MLQSIINTLFKRKKKAAKNQNEILETDKGFTMNYHNFTIHSHELQCIKATKEQIFKNEIYRFNTENDKPFIIDAGANIGMAIFYWKNKYPNSKIIAFEPSREVYKTLMENITINNLKDVQVFPYALSDTEGESYFTTNEKISGSLVLEKDLAHTYKVQKVKLSDYLKEQTVDFLKIDIEGEEKKVFFEIATYLSNVRNLFIEYHSFIHEEQYLSRILSELENQGFRYYIEDDFKIPHPLTNDFNSLNQDMKLNIWAKRNSN